MTNTVAYCSKMPCFYLGPSCIISDCNLILSVVYPKFKLDYSKFLPVACLLLGSLAYNLKGFYHIWLSYSISMYNSILPIVYIKFCSDNNSKTFKKEMKFWTCLKMLIACCIVFILILSFSEWNNYKKN
jgi:hypothetical protein